jgi:hypothetical protein
MTANTLLFFIIVALALLPIALLFIIRHWPDKPTLPPLQPKPQDDLTHLIGNAKLGTRNADTGGVWERGMYDREPYRVG